MVHVDRALAHSIGSPLALISKEGGCGSKKRMDMLGKVSGVGVGMKGTCKKKIISIKFNISVFH